MEEQVRIEAFYYPEKTIWVINFTGTNVIPSHEDWRLPGLLRDTKICRVPHQEALDLMKKLKFHPTKRDPGNYWVETPPVVILLSTLRRWAASQPVN